MNTIRRPDMDKTTASKSLKNRPTTLKLEYPERMEVTQMIYNVSEGKLADALQIMDKLQQLSPQALAYVEGAVNMAVLMSTASMEEPA